MGSEEKTREQLEEEIRLATGESSAIQQKLEGLRRELWKLRANAPSEEDLEFLRRCGFAEEPELEDETAKTWIARNAGAVVRIIWWDACVWGVAVDIKKTTDDDEFLIIEEYASAPRVRDAATSVLTSLSRTAEDIQAAQFVLSETST